VVKDVLRRIVKKVLKEKQASVLSTEVVKDVQIVLLGQILAAEKPSTMDIVLLVLSAYFRMINEVK
jgi:hypothetical protein